MKTIHTKHAPAAIGPYSQAKQAGGFVFPDKSVSTRLQEKLSPPTSPDKQSRSAKI